MRVLQPQLRSITFLLGVAMLDACAVGPAVQRPSALAPGAGCHNLAGTYANLSEKTEGHLLPQLFLEMPPLQHLETTVIEIAQDSDSMITVTARKRGHAVQSRAVNLTCEEGRFSVGGPSGWRSEGAGFTALIWRGSKIWLARDAAGDLFTEVQESRTGLLLMSFPVATRISRPTQRYRSVTESTVSTMDDMSVGAPGGALCSDEEVVLCAHGLTLDEDGEVTTAQLWWLLLNEEPPGDLSHVVLETTPDNQLKLSGWAGTQERTSTSLTTKGFHCRDGVLSPDEKDTGGMSLVGTYPLIIPIIGGNWRNLVIRRMDDGALLVHAAEQTAGTVFLVLPFHMDSEEWYRFASATGPEGWRSCPGSNPGQ